MRGCKCQNTWDLMHEQKWNQDGWAFLTWPDSSGWEEVKHMGWGNLGSWVIFRAAFEYWSVFLSCLSEWERSSELRHKLWAQPCVCLSLSTFCCCHLQRRMSWILPESGGNGEIPLSTWKNLFSVPGLQQKVGLKIRMGHSHSSRVVFVFRVYGRAVPFEKV